MDDPNLSSKTHQQIADRLAATLAELRKCHPSLTGLENEESRHEPMRKDERECELLLIEDSSSAPIRNWWKIRTVRGFFRSFVSRILIVYVLLTLFLVMMDWWGTRSKSSATVPNGRSSQPRGGQTAPKKTWWLRFLYAAGVAGMVVAGLLFVFFYRIDPSTIPPRLLIRSA